MRLTCLLLAFCVGMLAACSSTATMGQNECSAIDWRTIGYEDGVAGRPGAQIVVRRRACAKYGITPDLKVATDDQAETDRLWKAVVGNDGQESACSWCKDRWGLSWQITPRALTAAIADSDRAAAKRAFEAMMQMRKIDIATIEAARRG